MSFPPIAILHYSAAPVVGGVEAVISAHAAVLSDHGYPVTVIAGKGGSHAHQDRIDFVEIPEIDSQHPQVAAISSSLESGRIPDAFEPFANDLLTKLGNLLNKFEFIIMHNLFSKHFNLPLTVALARLMTQLPSKRWIAWSHDFTWTSQSSRSKVHPGFPWDLLRSFNANLIYVTVSQTRKDELVSLLKCRPEEVHVVYNGVDLAGLLGLSQEGLDLANRMDVFSGDLILLMPVRVTRAKNIELALQVVAALKSQGTNPRMIISGPPDPHDESSLQYFRELQLVRDQLDLDREFRFVYESGPHRDQPNIIDARIVGELFRMCDVMFMPSHYEGFAMPVLEAGLVGAAVVSTMVPATIEIAGEDVIGIQPDESPQTVATKILDWSNTNRQYQLRNRIRQRYTWNKIFEHDIRPLFMLG